jgi:hypothetical protein
MWQAIDMLWTTVFNLLSAINSSAQSVKNVTSVAEMHTEAFLKQETLEAAAKTAALEAKYKTN